MRIKQEIAYNRLQVFLLLLRLLSYGVAAILCLFLSTCSVSESSPEEVIATYVQLVNQGQLQAAKKWCTPAGIAHLEALETIIKAAEVPLDSTAVEVTVQHCQPQGSGLRCEVQIMDGFGPHTEFYNLVATSDGWRVDQEVAEGSTEIREEVMSVELDSL